MVQCVHVQSTLTLRTPRYKRTHAIMDKIQPPWRKLLTEVWLKITPAIMDSRARRVLLLGNYGHFRDTNMITILLFWLSIKRTSWTSHTTYSCINCSLLCSSSCVKDSVQVHVKEFAFPLCLRIFLPDSDDLTALFFSHLLLWTFASNYGLQTSTVCPEGIRYNDISLCCIHACWLE